MTELVKLPLEPEVFGQSDSPWNGPGTRPVDAGWTPENHAEWIAANVHHVLGAQLAQAGHKLLHGQDTLKDDIGRLTAGLDFYMSYVDNYGGWPELEARFGKQHDYVGKPWAYTSAGAASALLAAAGNRDFVKEYAHYGHGPHVCGPHTCGYPQADFTQWDDVGPQGQNVDQIVGYFPGSVATPFLVSITVTPPGHPAMFADVEPGGLTPSEFPHWYDHVAIHGKPQPPKPGPSPHQEADMFDTVHLAHDGIFVLFESRPDGSVWHSKQDKPGGKYSAPEQVLPAHGEPVASIRAEWEPKLRLFILFQNRADGSIWHASQKSPGGSYNSWAQATPAHK